MINKDKPNERGTGKEERQRKVRLQTKEGVIKCSKT